MLNGSFQDSDFTGSGDSVALQLDSGLYNKIYSFAHTNPYLNRTDCRAPCR
jgi:outer membrane protein assembly factor BamA